MPGKKWGSKFLNQIDVNLSGANLEDTNLENANLIGVNLIYTRLSLEQLQSTRSLHMGNEIPEAWE
jgi:uncharacterized protein YjbI with pentapeptide repeats